jgi:hypothetical protein
VLREVQVPPGGGSDFATIVSSAVAEAPRTRASFDARDAKFALQYDSGHVLPFVADSLVVTPPDARIAYIGANPVLDGMLASLVAELDLGPLARARLEDYSTAAGELDRIADVFIVDFGFDASVGNVSLGIADSSEFAQARARLIRCFDAFRHLVELERARLEAGEHPRRFLLVNSSAVFWNAYVLAHLHCSQTTPHSRVRHATVKLQPNDDEATRAANVRSLRLIRWMARRDVGQGRLRVRLGETMEIADLDDYAGFGDGWAYPDREAVWTRGPRSELSIAVDVTTDRSYLLTLGFDAVGVDPGDSLRVDLLANGTHVTASQLPRVPTQPGQRRSRADYREVWQTLRRPIAKLVKKARALGVPGVDAAIQMARRLVGGQAGDPTLTWNVALPAHALVDGNVDLALVIEEPASWSDDKQRGLHLRSLTIAEMSRPKRLDGMHDTGRTTLRADHP